LFTPDPNADPVHISDLQFTGAAILLKNAAAYKTTSIFASENKDIKPMSFINRMSAAERTKLADQISSANEHLTIDERRDPCLARNANRPSIRSGALKSIIDDRRAVKSGFARTETLKV
jgi:hypothetical protein